MDIHREVGLGDLSTGPDKIHELAFGHQLAGALHQGGEYLEGTAADRDRLVVEQ